MTVVAAIGVRRVGPEPRSPDMIRSPGGPRLHAGAGTDESSAMTYRISLLLLLAMTLRAGDAQQITLTPPKTESTVRMVTLDPSGQPTAEGQQLFVQMATDTWRAVGMSTVSAPGAAPVVVAVLFSRSMPAPKPATPPTPPPTAGQPSLPQSPPPPAGPDNEAAIAQALLATSKAPALQATASGLRYRAVRPGTGRKPGPTDLVTVRYTGVKLDGTVFDASARHGGTAQFPLNQVIKGWTEGLQLMQEGAVYHFVIPPELAYGKQGPPSIGPDQTLLFEVELISAQQH